MSETSTKITETSENPLFMTDKTLRTVCRPVEQGEDVMLLAANMMELMLRQRGVGLAANQVGDDRRVIVVNVPGWCRAAFVNPRIIKGFGAVRAEEGCLSFPGRKAIVERMKQVTFEATKMDGTVYKQKLRGLAARVVQHEIDHLDAVTIFDKGREV